MTINYLAGSRIQGLSSDTKPNNVQDFSTWEEIDTEKIYTFYKDTPAWKKIGSPSVGGWVELGRTTLGSQSTPITVSSLANKRYYMVLVNAILSTTTNTQSQFNNDTGSNYSNRMSVDGGADSTGTSQTISRFAGFGTSTPEFGVRYIANYTTKEKLIFNHVVNQNTAGAGTAPRRADYASKWVNTTTAINRMDMIDYLSSGSGYDTGSEVVVLGWDPLDTHTTNFWEELASVQLGVSGDNLSSGTFTAKKYLWVQAYLKSVTDVTGINVTFNNDTGNNYAQRQSFNGGADSTNVSRANFQPFTATLQDGKFVNMFIINNSANEKLVIVHGTQVSTAGAGTAPQRIEQVAKWTNTASQITEIDFDNASAGSYDVGSIIKVWGAN